MRLLYFFSASLCHSAPLCQKDLLEQFLSRVRRRVKEIMTQMLGNVIALDRCQMRLDGRALGCIRRDQHRALSRCSPVASIAHSSAPPEERKAASRLQFDMLLVRGAADLVQTPPVPDDDDTADGD